MARILLCAQKPIGEQSLRLILASPGLSVAGVVSNVQPTGWWKSASITQLAREKNIPLHPSENRDEAQLVDFVKFVNPDLLLSVQHAWKLSSTVFAMVKGNAFNLHLAPLPRYKGWNSATHAILNEDTEFGVTLHWMTNALDEGDIAYTASFPIDPFDDAASLYKKSQTEGLKLIETILRDLARGAIIPRNPMIGPGKMYQRSEIDPLREIPEGAEPRVIYRHARAFHFPPYEPAFIRCGDRKVYLVPDSAMRQTGSTF